jgi:hypothetical protein
VSLKKVKMIALAFGFTTLLSGCVGSITNNIASAATTNATTSKHKPASPTHYFPSRPTAFEYNLYDNNGKLVGTVSRTYTMISGNYAVYHDFGDFPSNLNFDQKIFLLELFGNQRGTNTPASVGMSVVAQTPSGIFLGDFATGDDSAAIRQMQKVGPSHFALYVPFAAANKVVTTEYTQITVLSTNKTVKAGGTTFKHVIEVKLISGSGTTQVIDYAPGVGLVKDTYYSGRALSGTMVFKSVASPNNQITFFSQVSSPLKVDFEMDKSSTGNSGAVLTFSGVLKGGYRINSLILVHGNQRTVNTIDQASLNALKLTPGQFWVSPDGALIGFEFTHAMSGQLAQFQITAKNSSGQAITGYSIPFIIP